MSKTITIMAAAVSKDKQNAVDVNNGRPAEELHHLSDARYEKEEEEEEEEMEEEVEEEEVDEEDEDDDIQDVCEQEEQCFNQLYLAVERRNRKAVRRLLMSSVDANVLETNKNNRRHLHATVKRLLNENANVDPRNTFDQTSLRMASQNGHLGIAQVLVKCNADANIRSDSDNIPLLVAVEMGYAEIVKALIDYDGEVNAVDKNGETLLHLAARNDLNAIVDFLLDQSAERDARTRLNHAANQGLSAELEHSQHAISNIVDANQIPQPIATQNGNFELEKTPLSVKAVSTGQAKPLHALLTAGRGEKDIVETLILKGANVNACNKVKMTPLHLACRNGLTSIVEILLDNHATVDVMKQAQKTPFYLASENGHADVVDVLLRRGIYDFVKMNETPLHVAVKKRHTKVVEVILKHSFRIFINKLTKDEQNLQENAKDVIETTGIMPIEFTKPDGRRFSARIFWTEKSTPLELMGDLFGYTALAHAVKSSQPKMVKILLSVDPCLYSEKHLGNSFRSMIETIKPPDSWYEAISNQKRRYKLHSKVKRRNIINIMEFLCYDIQHKMKCNNIKEIAQVLLNSSKFKVNHQDDELNTLLHDVMKQCGECVHDYLIKTIDDVIKLLLEKGADFNMKNAFEETPLIIASEKGCSHAIQNLFDWEQKSGMKLDLDAKDQYGATALIKAAENHHVSVMRLLLNQKVSVNLHDYYGFTALHAAVYEPNRNWFDLHFFCKGLRKRKIDTDEYLKISRWGRAEWGKQTVDRYTTINQLAKNLELYYKKTRFKEEMVKLLLTTDELNVNAIDVRGNTPLDLAVKSTERLTSKTFEALKDRGAIRSLLEPEDEAPIEVASVDERGRSPLHRLIISHISDCTVGEKKARNELDHERFNLMVHGIHLKPENFSPLATATDDKGRTPLHYAVLPTSYNCEQDSVLVRFLLEIGSNVNAADVYGETPLHYVEMYDQYELLIKNGADENTKDNYGYTPRDLRQLRDSVAFNKYDVKKLPIGKQALLTSEDTVHVLNINHDIVTELSKRKWAEAFRIYSQSPRPKESSEEAIWKVWIENEFHSLNRRVNQLKPSIQRLIERLADVIKEKDWRFECQPILVGSADEETKAVISADFDFNFKLIHFSQLCDVFPHPLGPKGYFQLRRTSQNTERRQSDEEFACFFNLDQCLLTNKVNSRFQIALVDVLHEPSFWQDEHLFEWNLFERGVDVIKSAEPAGMCKTVRLRMIHPTEDGDGGFLFVNVSIDIVACVHVQDLWLGDQLPVAISPSGKADGCTLVFDRPRFDPSKPRSDHYIFSDTFARISFAPLESRTIRESSSLIKAAYIVCKLILYDHPKTTYQLKTSLFFCMEALKGRKGCERNDEDKITKKELAFWVERIMFCFMEFHRDDVYPCYFMPSFRQRVIRMNSYSDSRNCHLPYHYEYSAAYDIYLDLCLDDTTIDIDIIVKNEEFDREEFIRKLSSRNSSY